MGRGCAVGHAKQKHIAHRGFGGQCVDAGLVQLVGVNAADQTQGSVLAHPRACAGKVRLAFDLVHSECITVGVGRASQKIHRGSTDGASAFQRQLERSHFGCVVSRVQGERQGAQVGAVAAANLVGEGVGHQAVGQAAVGHGVGVAAIGLDNECAVDTAQAQLCAQGCQTVSGGGCALESGKNLFGRIARQVVAHQVAAQGSPGGCTGFVDQAEIVHRHHEALSRWRNHQRLHTGFGCIDLV